MKQVKFRSSVSVAMAIVLGATLLFAQDKTFLSRSQWLKKIGASVMSLSVLKETFAQVDPSDQVEFTQRVLKAVSRLPVAPEEKAAVFVRAAVACIAGAAADLKYKVIAEVFAGVPVEYLPVVSEALAKRFDQEYNQLSDELYEKIASAAIREAVARNAKTDEPSVRNTFVLLAFLRGAKSPQLQDKLLALLPDERMRTLATSWLAAALKDRNYEALLAAANAELAISYEMMTRFLSLSPLEQLLFDIGTGAPLSDVTRNGFFDPPSTRFVQPVDFGVNRVPSGYQNQGTTILKKRRGDS